MSFLFDIPLLTLPKALFTFRFSSKQVKLSSIWSKELVQHVLGFYLDSCCDKAVFHRLWLQRGNTQIGIKATKRAVRNLDVAVGMGEIHPNCTERGEGWEEGEPAWGPCASQQSSGSQLALGLHRAR